MLLVHSPGPAHMRQSLAAFSPLKEAIETEEAQPPSRKSTACSFQLVAVPVFGPDVIGFLLLGQAIDDTVR